MFQMFPMYSHHLNIYISRMLLSNAAEYIYVTLHGEYSLEIGVGTVKKMGL